MANFDDMKLAVEALSGGKNTVLLDDRGMPSIMVAFPKFKISDVIAGGSENIHPAFSVGGAEKDVVYVSKFQNIVMNDRAYSLPFNGPEDRRELRPVRQLLQKQRNWMGPDAVFLMERYRSVV